ncbi:choline/ethanolamine kinase family protein [Clostridium botulinum]|uniref:choline/ethanolamine kinase family protein n=1 Tax=Clostridium botulinum TaxID=1491 RepID=UPI001E3AFB60|nr:choline/ethanolamine kinase family protein [Clostridium botulinum]
MLNKRNEYIVDNTINEQLQKILFRLNINVEDIISIDKLGGLTNNNYKITLHNDELVVRIPGENTKEFIDRVNEKNNSQIAELLGLDSKCIYFDEITGVKISKFIKDAETLDEITGKNIENIKFIADKLNKLHSSNKSFHTTFDPFQTIKAYESKLINYNVGMYEGYYDIKNLFLTFKDILENMNISYVPCHIDPLPQNFVKGENEELYLIDWEYSGNYDPLWDLAAVMLECNFSHKEEKLLLYNYLGRNPNSKELLRIHIHKIIQDIFWSLWASNKLAKGEYKMKDFSVKKFESARKNIDNYIRVNINI